MLVPEELPHDDVGEGADQVHEAAVGGVVEPVVPRGGVVPLELARRRVAKDDHLQESRRVRGAMGEGREGLEDAARPA